MIIQKFESFLNEFDEARFNISDGDSYLFFILVNICLMCLK